MREEAPLTDAELEELRRQCEWIRTRTDNIGPHYAADTVARLIATVDALKRAREAGGDA